MKRLLLLAFVIVSCAVAFSEIRNISEKDGETYFSIDGKNAEFMGTFGQNSDPTMWSVGKNDFSKIEQIIWDHANNKTAYKRGTALTETETNLLRNLLSVNYYRVYTAGTNAQHQKIMDVLFYKKQNSDTIVADIIVNISTESILIR